MRSFLRAAPAALLAVLSLSGKSLAGDEESFTLKLLPKVEKGQRETIDFEGSMDRETKKKTIPVTTFTSKATREIVSLDEDGRAATERWDSGGFQANVGGNNSWQAGIPMNMQIARRGKGRHGAIQNGDPFEGLLDGMDEFKLVKEIIPRLLDDPDALPRLAMPASRVEKGEEWDVDAAALLVAFGPPRAKLVLEGSKATATLDSVKTKEGKKRARIVVEAKIKFSPHDDPENETRLTLKGSIKGPIDGSQPPDFVEISITTKAEGKRETSTVKLTRTPIEPEPDDEDPKKPAGKKDEKKPEKKDGEKNDEKKTDEKKTGEMKPDEKKEAKKDE